MPNNPNTPVDRDAICRALGLTGVMEAHNLIVSAAKSTIDSMLKRGLNSAKLTSLGYTRDNLTRLGFNERQLQELGFVAPAPRSEPAPVPASSSHPAINPAAIVEASTDRGERTAQLKELIRQGKKAHELKAGGFAVSDARRANVMPDELERIGFSLGELAQVFGAAELRRGGFRPRDLLSYFNGSDLRNAGYSAPDMRAAGFGVRDLLRFGYSENHIIGAGFSVLELTREGLGVHVREDLKK